MNKSRQPIGATPLGIQWGRLLLARRTALGLSQAQVADIAGIAQQSVGRFESGDQIPLDRTKLALARALGTTPGALFPWPELADLIAPDAAA